MCCANKILSIVYFNIAHSITNKKCSNNIKNQLCPSLFVNNHTFQPDLGCFPYAGY